MSTRTSRLIRRSRSTARSGRSPGCGWWLSGVRPGGCWPGRNRWASERSWAVESAGGLGKLLAQQLVEAGGHVIDVPPTPAARVRLLGSSKASKNGPNDALATAIAGLRHCGLRAVRVEDHTAGLRMLIDRYDDLVALRTRAACRLHVTLRELIAGGAAPPSRG
ncbi:MAG: IS110 family transposase [Acidimicrobiales bacterium]